MDYVFRDAWLNCQVICHNSPYLPGLKGNADQKRDKPELMVQVRALQAFARDHGLIFVFISQIDRSYDPQKKPCPDLDDVRLPNPLDLSLFTKTCFLNDGEIRFGAAS